LCCSMTGQIPKCVSHGDARTLDIPFSAKNRFRKRHSVIALPSSTFQGKLHWRMFATSAALSLTLESIRLNSTWFLQMLSISNLYSNISGTEQHLTIPNHLITCFLISSLQTQIKQQVSATTTALQQVFLVMPSKIQLDENLWFLYICLQKSDLKTVSDASKPLDHFFSLPPTSSFAQPTSPVPIHKTSSSTLITSLTLRRSISLPSAPQPTSSPPPHECATLVSGDRSNPAL
jgi:hypothetical protein